MIKFIQCAIILGMMIAVPVMATRSKPKPTYTPPPNDVIADLLGWVPTPNRTCFLCGGYFFEPEDIRLHPYPGPYAEQPTKITARGPTIFSKTGESVLQKDVRVTQTGRIAQADKAYIYREKKTGHVTRVKLVGHVRLHEHDKLLVADKATLNLKKNTAHLKNVLYRLTKTSGRMGENTSWGTAEKGKRLPNGNIQLENATYSTCSPLNPAWQFHAKHILLDPKNKKGIAKNVSLRLWNVPLLYTPYLSFSINRVRKSGILSPILENSSKNGFTIGLPYYWNMAPNYDMLITPIYFSKRGFQINSLFRYLTKSSEGNLFVSYIPNDQEFERFKQDTFSQFPEPINPVYQPYIKQLRKSSNDRAYFAYNNRTHFSSRWTTNAQINYVSDDYYLRDFGAAINDVIANQLLNQFDLNYEGLHWNLTLLGQAYQTLHLIDQSTTPTVNQYMRLPELDTSADYPHMFDDVDFNVSMQAVNFMYDSIFPPITDETPAGQRFHIRPTFSQPINWAAGYFTPSISIDSTTYNVTRPQPPQASSSSRALPIVNIDTGLYFNREFMFRSHDYFQTLEPRLFYLYVPFENQNRYPIYDTQILPFSYAQLFGVNRFVGFDRLQNANQISLGLTSRILDANDGHPILRASTGIAYYIDLPKVCLTPGCVIGNEHWSPLANELTFSPTPYWAISGNFTWDAELAQTNNIQLNVSYTRDGKHILGAGYTFVHTQPSAPSYSETGFSTNSALYSVYLAWPLFDHWSTLGYFYYNVTQHRPENYFAGLQLDTCCLSFRFIIDQAFLGRQPLSSGTQLVNRYSTNYIFQIQLKGIGSAGNVNPYAMLENGIPGYHDPFRY